MEIQRINIAESDRTLVSDFMGESFPLTVDFNHLMPVVEKIEELPYRNIQFKTIKNYTLLSFYSKTEKIDSFGNYKLLFSAGFKGTTKIESVWLAVVEFIQWYNKQKQK